MIKTRRLENVVIFTQTTLSFVQSRDIINIYNNLFLCFIHFNKVITKHWNI